MKIVIDIPEEVLQAIKTHQVLPSQIDIICEAVLNGIIKEDNNERREQQERSTL